MLLSLKYSLEWNKPSEIPKHFTRSEYIVKNGNSGIKNRNDKTNSSKLHLTNLKIARKRIVSNDFIRQNKK